MSVIVVGTSITGRPVSSTTHGYYFRMSPWEQPDLSKFLVGREDSLSLVEGETVDTVANAIFAHPKLCALATNARSAAYLVDSIEELSIGCTRSSWEMQLDEWTPILVTKVVSMYINKNGLRYLNVIQRRRVAAFILRAVHQLKAGDTTLPTFEGLGDSTMIPAAESLLQYNLERLDSNHEIIRSEKFAFTVTPSIAMILYSLAGVYAPLVPGLKNEEEIAALYAARQLILQCMERYESDVRQGLSQESCLNQLDESLAKSVC